MPDHDLSCVLARHGLGINNQGYLTPCCQWKAPRSGLPDCRWQDTDRYLKEVRPKIVQDLESGIRHAGCAHCWHEEDLGYKSMRLDWNPRIAAQIDLDAIKDSPNHVLDIELALGNFCNLKCMMCGPYASSQWETAYRRDPDKLITWQLLPEVKNWVEDPGFMDWLRPNLKTCLRVNFTGGEPLIIPQTEMVLDEIIALGRAPDINLQFSSNFTKVTDRMLHKLSTFRQVNISASLEGTGAMNDYVRFPSEWSVVKKNILTVKQSWSEKIHIGINHTMQHASAYSFPSLAEFCYENDLDLHLTSVYGHPQLSMTGVPPRDLERFIAWARNTTWLSDSSWARHRGKNVNEYVLNLESTQFDPDVYHQFRQYVDFLDNSHNMRWDEIFQPSDPFAPVESTSDWRGFRIKKSAPTS